MHPLAPNLTELKDDELQKKYSDLMGRLTWATRMGNGHMADQIRMLLADYQTEVNRRQQKLLDDLASKNGNFSGIIDIK